jgi:hypothetical protein
VEQYFVNKLSRVHVTVGPPTLSVQNMRHRDGFDSADL